MSFSPPDPDINPNAGRARAFGDAGLFSYAGKGFAANEYGPPAAVSQVVYPDVSIYPSNTPPWQAGSASALVFWAIVGSFTSNIYGRVFWARLGSDDSAAARIYWSAVDAGVSSQARIYFALVKT